MKQAFLTFALADERTRRAVTEELTRRGFRVNDARRQPGRSVNIRIREGTADSSEVEQVIATLAPTATRLPASTPSKNLSGYREGR